MASAIFCLSWFLHLVLGRRGAFVSDLFVQHCKKTCRLIIKNGSCRDQKGNLQTDFILNFEKLRAVLGGFCRRLFLSRHKQGKKLTIHNYIQISVEELHSQHPRCKDLALNLQHIDSSLTTPTKRDCAKPRQQVKFIDHALGVSQ